MTDIKIDPDISRATRDIFKNFDIKLAYLFGSWAKGRSVPESDFDIAVLFKVPPSDPLALEETSLLTLELDALFPAKVDVVSLNEAPLLLKYEIVAHGKPLYCENEQERVNFEVTVIKEYIDDQYVRDIYTQAMVDRINSGVF